MVVPLIPNYPKLLFYLYCKSTTFGQEENDNFSLARYFELL